MINNTVSLPNGKNLFLPLLTRWLFIILGLGILLIGSVFVVLSAYEAEQVMRRTMLSEVGKIVHAIDQERFLRLTATSSDEQSADYQYLHNMLKRMQAADPTYRYLYLIGKRKSGPPFFYMGSAPVGAEDYAPPGLPYPETAPALAHVLSTGEATVSQPVTDRWGTWISALAPLRDHATGQMLAVFGMDIDTRDWQSSIRVRTILPGALTLLIILMLSLFYFWFRNRQRDRTEFLLLEQNRILAVQIAERQRAEADLRASEFKYRSLIENTNDIIYSLTEEGVFTFVSPAWTRLLGHPTTEVEGSSFNDFIHPEDLPHCYAFLQKALENGERQEGVEYRIRRKNGEWRWHTSSANPKKDAVGAVTGFDSIARDITERKRAEEEKEKLQAQLTQAQKMESVGRLAGGIAHDFNNMLGVILGHTEIDLSRIGLDDPLRASMADIQMAAQRSADLTRQLLAFARKQTIQPRELDLNETVEEMLKMLRRLIGEDINLVWLPGKKLWPVRLDPSQIDQILANLCVNARDAIDGVGAITIETGNVFFDEHDCVQRAGFIPGDYALLAVSDNGRGMDADTLSHLFEPFFTTKEMGRGTGLGLSTVYGAVKQNNGFINVYSEPGRGTTFKIYLPRHTTGIAPEPENIKPRATARGSETILLVEDEPLLLEVTATMLEMLGYTTLSASTPSEAMRLAQNHPGRIELLMTDVVMPEMNGWDLAKKLLSIHPDIRQLFMSGYTANVIAHQGVVDESANFLQKPFSLKDLATKIRETIGD